MLPRLEFRGSPFRFPRPVSRPQEVACGAICARRRCLRHRAGCGNPSFARKQENGFAISEPTAAWQLALVHPRSRFIFKTSPSGWQNIVYGLYTRLLPSSWKLYLLDILCSISISNGIENVTRCHVKGIRWPGARKNYIVSPLGTEKI